MPTTHHSGPSEAAPCSPSRRRKVAWRRCRQAGCLLRSSGSGSVSMPPNAQQAFATRAWHSLPNSSHSTCWLHLPSSAASPVAPTSSSILLPVCVCVTHEVSASGTHATHEERTSQVKVSQQRHVRHLGSNLAESFCSHAIGCLAQEGGGVREAQSCAPSTRYINSLVNSTRTSFGHTAISSATPTAPAAPTRLPVRRNVASEPN